MPGAILLSKGRKIIIGTVPVLKEFKYIRVEWSRKMLSVWMMKVNNCFKGSLTLNQEEEKENNIKEFPRAGKTSTEQKTCKVSQGDPSLSGFNCTLAITGH